MNDKLRRWFQIHLSTAIAMICVTAAFIGANYVGHNHDYGWPFSFYSSAGFRNPAIKFEPVFLAFDVIAGALFLGNTGLCAEIYTRNKSPLFILIALAFGIGFSFVLLKSLTLILQQFC